VSNEAAPPTIVAKVIADSNQEKPRRGQTENYQIALIAPAASGTSPAVTATVVVHQETALISGTGETGKKLVRAHYDEEVSIRLGPEPDSGIRTGPQPLADPARRRREPDALRCGAD
jgi:hypothetical protein